MATERETLKVLALLSAAYPRFDMPEATMHLYVRLLADIPAEVLEASALAHVSRSQWFPSVAELRGGAHELTARPERSGAEAWGDVIDAVARHGWRGGYDLGGGEPSFADPVVAQIVAGLGWREICLTEEVMPMRAHFIKAYEQGRQRASAEAVMLPEVRALIGKTADRLALK